jgi:hypothetical protein
MAAVLTIAIAAIPATVRSQLGGRIDYPAGRGPICVISIDVDGDRNMDLAVVNSVETKDDLSVAILKNDGAGSFILTDKYPMNCPQWMCAADFDSDGDVDLALGDEDACWTDGSGRIVVLDNDGSGTFSIVHELNVTGDPQAICCADFNSDSAPDLAVNLRSQDAVAVYMNDGSGGFGSAVACPVGDSPDRGLSSGDVDGDGDPDLFVGNRTAGTISILVNDGSGVFAELCQIPSGGVHPQEIWCGDLSEDGVLDFAVALQGSDSIAVHLGDGSCAFPTLSLYEAGIGPLSITGSDVNLDGDIDLVITDVGSDELHLYLNQGGGVFRTPVGYSVGDEPWDVCAADLDRDGDDEIAVANYEGESVSIFGNIHCGECPEVICHDRLSDIDCDGFVTALDLARIIDELFAGGPPAVPCQTDPLGQ